MEQNKAEEGMSNDMLEIVLRELLAEQQKANDMAVDQVEILNQLAAKLKAMEENASLPVVAPAAINTKPIEEIVRKGMVDLQAIADNKPKNITRKVQIRNAPSSTFIVQ